MGNCVYCGKKAGLFKSVHPECEEKHSQGIAKIKKLPLLYSIDEPFAQTIEASKQIAADCFIDELARLRALIDGIGMLAEKYLDDGVITVDGEKTMSALVTSINYDFSAINEKIKKGVALRNLAEGTMPNIKLDRCPIDLEENERIIYVFSGVAFYRTARAGQYEEKNSGFLRGAKRDYQGPSIFKGYPVAGNALEPIDVGKLFVTDKNIYFYSEAMNEKISLNEIMATTNYNDGIGIQKDEKAAKYTVFKMLFHPEDGWFVCNIVLYLLEAIKGAQINVPNDIAKEPLQTAAEEKEDAGMKPEEIRGKHFEYGKKIVEHYALRNKNPTHLYLAIQFCYDQIKIAKYALPELMKGTKMPRMKDSDKFMKELLDFQSGKTKEEPSSYEEGEFDCIKMSHPPTHAGYTQLCIIRAQEERWEEVLSLATQAKTEGWTGDWDKRIEKARKKLGA